MAFTRGHIGGRVNPSGTRTLWMPHHEATGFIYEFTFDPNSYGPPDSQDVRNEWGYLDQAPRNLGALYAGVTNQDPNNYPKPMGFRWDDDRKRMLTSGRSIYAASVVPNDYQVPTDTTATPPGIEDPEHYPGLDMQRFGGGYCDIPQSFADQYLGGDQRGICRGGYESGQGSSMGPSLASANGTILLCYVWNGPREQREQRDNLYEPGTVAWAIAPDGDIGYWSCERIEGSFWLPGAGYYALTYQGLGKYDYNKQGLGGSWGYVFAEERQLVLYRYSEELLAEVARGDKQPHEPRGERSDWVYARQDLQTPKGFWYDSEDNRLYILHTEVWKTRPDATERLPVMTVYSVD